jgi:hypothetical protein
MSEVPSSLQLLSEGKIVKKEGRLDEAIEMLARAVEARMSEEGTEISGGLAEFLIQYADALLCKEETNSAAFLATGTDPAIDSDDDEGTIPRLDSGRIDQPPGADEAEEEVLSDLQLAWESFEHARLCLLTVENSDQRMKDLSFIHCRLGDIQALQDQFISSITDYAESIRHAMDSSSPARKVAGLLVSLSQTIQAFMTSEEIKSESFNEFEFVDRLKNLFRDVEAKYEIPTLQPSGTAVALVARDGFLLANALLSKIQSSEETTDLKATISELQACADDCAQQQAEIREAKVLVPGVTSSGFAKPSGNEATSAVVTVSVKRKTVSGENEERSEAAEDADPVVKKSKETLPAVSEKERADKATLVD